MILYFLRCCEISPQLEIPAHGVEYLPGHQRREIDLKLANGQDQFSSIRKQLHVFGTEAEFLGLVHDKERVRIRLGGHVFLGV